MKNNLSEARIREISREVVEKSIPEEIGLFDSIWLVMKNFIARWKDDLPQEWHETQFSEGFLSEMGFLDEAEVAEINTPKVIALISLVWLRLAHAEGVIREDIIEDTFAKYGKALPEWLRMKTIKLAVPMIREDLKKTGRIPFLVAEDAKKYIMYSHETRKGEPISESELEKYSQDRNDYFIWLDETNQDLLIKGKRPAHVFPEERRALAYLIKNNGEIAHYDKLYLAIHNIRDIQVEEWGNRYAEYVNDIHKCKSKLIEHCPEIRRFITIVSTFGYKLELPEEIKYCLVKELPEKIP